jgi:hypothetical protein
MRIQIRDPDPGSGIFLIRDPGWKNLDPGETSSRIRNTVTVAEQEQVGSQHPMVP